MVRPHSYSKGDGKPTEWFVLINSKGSVLVQREDGSRLSVESETGLVLVDIEKKKVVPDYLGR